jgi:thiamine-phosphate pyrophosphorylase
MTPAEARPRLIVVTHPKLDDDTLVARVADVAAALLPGVLAVQLRDKARDQNALLVLAARLREVTAKRGAMLLVNSDAEVALKVGADGLHLPSDAMTVAEARSILGPTSWVSINGHSDEDVARGVSAGATAALVSPIFTTPGKGTPRGLAALEAAHALAQGRMALFALGGVDRVNAPLCLRAGADGVAVVGAVLAAADPAAEARAIYASIQSAVLRPVRRHA